MHKVSGKPVNRPKVHGRVLRDMRRVVGAGLPNSVRSESVIVNQDRTNLIYKEKIRSDIAYHKNSRFNRKRSICRIFDFNVRASR